MDHIDTLHKHNKQQNQVEAEMLSLDDPSKQLGRLPLPATPFNSSSLFRPPPAGYNSVHAMSRPATSQYNRMNSVNRTETAVSGIKKQSTNNLCSFNLLGSLKPADRPKRSEVKPNNWCKFYFGKKGNPLANARSTPLLNTSIKFEPGITNNNRRYSLPNVLDGCTNSTLPNFSYPYRLLPPASTMAAAAMQQSYLFGMRPPMFPQSFYPHARLPMMLPSRTATLSDGPQTTQHQQQTVQFLNQMNTLSHSIRSSPRSSVSSHSESPLDLTKSYL